MARLHTTATTAAVAVTAGILIAACGSSPAPSAGSAGSTGFTTQAYRFAHCMRTHGLPGFPEPKIQVGNGHDSVAIRVTPGISSSPSFQSASKACQSLLPGPGSETAAQRRTHTVDLLSFARCMRAHGITSFPDPTPQGDISRTQLAAAHVDIALPDVQHSAFECVPAAHGLLTAAAVRQAISHAGSSGG
jgi:hypothetical protein